MNGTPLPVSLEEARERTIRTLGEHFARDVLDERELEARLDRALAATSLVQLREVLADLPALDSAPLSSVPTAPADQVADRQTILAVMGGGCRRGSWTPPRTLQVLAVMGGAELDFREARFGTGVVEVNVLAVMGGVEVIVPPGVRVEVTGMAFMGGFDQRASGSSADPSAPLVRVGGFALMGGVEVKTRLPGESAREAKDRERLERKEMRRLRHGG